MKSKPASRMAADADDPWISVSDLGEYAFCPRAGLLAHESSEDDSGTERDRGPGSRNFYDVDGLRRKLADLDKTYSTLQTVLLVAGIIFAVSIFALLGAKQWLFLPFAVIAGLVCSQVWSMMSDNRSEADHYLDQLQLAESAIANVPGPKHQSRTSIDWWSLLQGGCESVRVFDQLRDTSWRIAGKPWRVLVYRGINKMPVFRMRLRHKLKRDEWVIDKRVFHQHILRAAAYAHLLEACENAQSPYGIVMYGSTSEGMTIPIHIGQKKKLHEAIRAFRKLIRDARRNRLPAKPRSTHICRGCPWGKPEGFWIFAQSTCGARFNWRPPHSDE